MVGPDYHLKDEIISEEWVSPNKQEVIISNQEPLTEWWTLFKDSLLNRYICVAYEYNTDLIVAKANLFRARATRNAAASVLYPQIYSDINVTRQAFSRNGPLFLFGDDFQSVEAFSIPRYQTLYNIVFDMTWELDFFGKNARSVEAAQDNLYAACANLNDVMLSIFAEVASNYIEARSNQERIALTEKNIELLQKNVNLIKSRLEAGLDNQLNLERIEAEYLNLKATLPQAKIDLLSNIYSLATLLGLLPECIFDEMIVPQTLPELPQEIAVGLRSDLLRRRPDVRRAEWELASATANIGVAIASFFPTFTLSGNIGLQSLNLNNLISPNSTLWAIQGDMNTPVFTGWLLEANLDMAKADTYAAFARYEKAVLTAVKEAETALASLTENSVALRDYQQAVQRYGHLVSMNNKRYTGGLVNLTDLLDSERQLISSELNLLYTKTASLIDLIVLYKALGGGWSQSANCSIAEASD